MRTDVEKETVNLGNVGLILKDENLYLEDVDLTIETEHLQGAGRAKQPKQEVTELQTDTELDATSNDELRELVAEWREAQKRREENPDASPIQAQVLGRCAGELEQLIGDGDE